MTINPETLKITVNERDSVTALLYAAPKKKRAAATIILGHGAGSNQLSPFMRLFASGLAERGFDALTFNFQYMEQRRSVPDAKAKLEACYLSVIEAALKNKKLTGNRVVVGGKSMGGRIASQVAAALDRGDLNLSNVPMASPRKSQSKAIPSSIAGLVFLGYPLHPPGKPDQLRDAHLPQIKSPMLFVQGSRDAFGSAEEIRATIKKHHLSATLHVVERGDHSLKVSKSSGLTQTDVYESTLDTISSWLLNLAC